MIRKTLLTASALTALAATPAFADDSIAVIQGPLGNTCKVTVSKTHEAPGMGGVDETAFSGATRCDQAVQQTGHAYVPAGAGDPGPLDGGTCSGLRAVCTSGGSQRDTGEYGAAMVYDATLSLPAGQTWLAAPAECAGAGTRTVTCRFTVDDGLLWFRVLP